MKIKSLLKNRFVLAGICAVSAIIIGIIAVSVFNANNKEIDVVRVVQGVTINKGNEITSEQVEIKSIGSYNIPQNAVKSLDDVVGKYALTDMVSEDLVLSDKLTEEISTANEKLLVLEQGKYAYAVSFPTFESSLANKLIGGDIVSVVITNKMPINTDANEESTENYYGNGEIAYGSDDYNYSGIPAELNYVKVLSTTTGSGIDKKGANDAMEENLSSVILELNREQLLKIKELENNSNNITFAFVCRGDNAEAADKYLMSQQTYFDEQKRQAAYETAGASDDMITNENGEDKIADENAESKTIGESTSNEE